MNLEEPQSFYTNEMSHSMEPQPNPSTNTSKSKSISGKFMQFKKLGTNVTPFKISSSIIDSPFSKNQSIESQTNAQSSFQWKHPSNAASLESPPNKTKEKIKDQSKLSDAIQFPSKRIEIEIPPLANAISHSLDVPLIPTTKPSIHDQRPLFNFKPIKPSENPNIDSELLLQKKIHSIPEGSNPPNQPQRHPQFAATKSTHVFDTNQSHQEVSNFKFKFRKPDGPTTKAAHDSLIKNEKIPVPRIQDLKEFESFPTSTENAFSFPEAKSFSSEAPTSNQVPRPDFVGPKQAQNFKNPERISFLYTDSGTQSDCLIYTQHEVFSMMDEFRKKFTNLDAKSSQINEYIVSQADALQNVLQQQQKLISMSLRLFEEFNMPPERLKKKGPPTKRPNLMESHSTKQKTDPKDFPAQKPDSNVDKSNVADAMEIRVEAPTPIPQDPGCFLPENLRHSDEAAPD